jgi:hypothetical protein
MSAGVFCVTVLFMQCVLMLTLCKDSINTAFG